MDPRYTRILIGIVSAIVVLLIALVVVLATGGDDEPAAAETTTTSTTSTTAAPATTSTTVPATTSTTIPATTTTTTSGTTTSTSTTTTTAAPAGPCGALPSTSVAGGATDQSVAFGDLDGDGAEDTLTVYRSAGSWWLNVTLDYGWATEIPLTGMVGEAITVADLGVAEEVAIAKIDAGASTGIYGFFAFQSCSIVHTTDGNTGFETAFPIGGGVTHLDGITCTADGIRTTSAMNDIDDPALWEYTETDYLWVPGLAEFQPIASSIQMLTSPDDDAVIFGAGDFDC